MNTHTFMMWPATSGADIAFIGTVLFISLDWSVITKRYSLRRLALVYSPNISIHTNVNASFDGKS